MTPRAWREMVERTRELESALGSSLKTVALNEEETVVVQRRCLHTKEHLPAGIILAPEMLVALRPAPRGAVMPFQLPEVIGKCLTQPVAEGECLRWSAVEDLRACECGS